MPLKVEIGGGRNPREGYTNCDVRKLETVDHVCEADNLPFEDGTVDEIYSRHVIEHFTIKEFLKILSEWNRVLKTGGKLYIICPNLIFHLKQVLNGSHESFYTKESGGNDRYWGMGSLFGWQQNEYDIHKFGYYYDLLKDVLEDMGFDQVVDHTGKEESLENAAWHLEVSAQKAIRSIDYSDSTFYNHFNVSH